MPAIPSSIIEPVWDQVAVLLPDRTDTHPLGCHRPRMPDRLIVDKLGQVLVIGYAYHRISDTTVSATTLRQRRDEWIVAGVMPAVLKLVLGAYDRMIGLVLADLSIDCCLTKEPRGGERAGRSPVDRGKEGIKRSRAVGATGIPLVTVATQDNRPDAHLLASTLDGLTVTDIAMTVHLDRGYDSNRIRSLLAGYGFGHAIACRGMPAPISAGRRWVVERTTTWTNAHKKLVWCTERRS